VSPVHHIQGCDRNQTLLLPNSVDDYIGPDNPIRFVDAFVGQLDMQEAGFFRVEPNETGRLIAASLLLPRPELIQARLQSPSKGPLRPTVGSELGKTKWAIRSVMAAVGASRQISQLWSGG